VHAVTEPSIHGDGSLARPKFHPPTAPISRAAKNRRWGNNVGVKVLKPAMAS
jgi:hypothetical protein